MKNKKKEFLDLSELCWQTYKTRLGDELLADGERYYNKYNEFILDQAMKLGEIKNFSLSCSVDPSIHYFIRYEDEKCLAIENYITPDEDGCIFYFMYFLKDDNEGEISYRVETIEEVFKTINEELNELEKNK